MRASFTLVALLAWVATDAMAAELAQPTIRTFAQPLSKADLYRDGRGVIPAPHLSVLSASRDASGAIRLQCSGVENPAYHAWLERIDDSARQAP